MPDDVMPPEQPKPEVKPRPIFEAGSEALPIIPRTLQEVALWADAVIKARMVPNSYEVEPSSLKVGDYASEKDWQQNRHADAQAMTKARLMIGIEKGLEVGMGPITALSTIMIVNNRPCIWGDGAVALCQQKGKVDWVKQSFSGTEEQDGWTAHFEIKRVRQDEPYKASFSVKDAKRAKLWANAQKTPWIQYPQRMLMARARAYALREGFADCLMGLGIAEEVQDIPVQAATPAVADRSFLEDAPRIEHKPEINLAAAPATAESPKAERSAVTAAEPSGTSAQAGPSPVAAGEGNGAGPSSAEPPTRDDDWRMVVDELILDIDGARNAADLTDVADRAVKALADAPAGFGKRVSDKIADKRKKLKAG